MSADDTEGRTREGVGALGHREPLLRPVSEELTQPTSMRQQSSERRGRALGQKQASMQRITAEELARHTARDDAWIAVDGLVFNITPHINSHPGWYNGSVTTVVAIMQYLGKDATLAWHAVGIHASQKVMAELNAYQIGVLAGGPADGSGGPDARASVSTHSKAWSQRKPLRKQPAASHSDVHSWRLSAVGAAGFVLAGAFAALGML